LVMAQVREAANERGCGFRGLFGETPVLGLFTNGSILSTMSKSG